VGIVPSLLALPLALGGESLSAHDNTGIAVVAVVSMVCGYVLLGCLWYFVFRDKAKAKRKRD
jgi:hypothetical protein